MDPIFVPYLEKIECALRTALPAQENSAWLHASFAQLPDGAAYEHTATLTEPCRALINLGGKRWRPLLMTLCAQAARECGKADRQPLSEEALYSLTPLVEFVHTASLIHDDIEDRAEVRRGQPCAYVRYGLDTALNAGAWLYFEAATCIPALDADCAFKTALYSLYAEELRRLHLGQAMDIAWHRDASYFPSLAEYSAMVRCKTGTLSALAARLGVTAGGGCGEMCAEAGKIAASLGEGFQILDDVQNLTAGNAGKQRGDDIVEGKKSLPVLLHLQEHPSDAASLMRFMETAAREGIASQAVERCISLLESGGAIGKAEETGRRLIENGSRQLSELFCGGKTAGAQLIQQLFADLLLSFQKTA